MNTPKQQEELADAMGKEQCQEEAAAAIERNSILRQSPMMPREQLDALYHELLYAVAQKFPGETRHQTALRYIREAENRSIDGPAQEAKTL